MISQYLHDDNLSIFVIVKLFRCGDTLLNDTMYQNITHT